MKPSRSRPEASQDQRAMTLGRRIWVLALANVAVGMLLSPMTAVHRVRVIGAPPADQTRISRHLQGLAGAAFALTPVREVESRILANSEIERVSLRHNLFGSGVLTVTGKKPVARLDASKPVLLSDRGSAYLASRTPANLPLVRLQAEALNANLCLSGAWEAQRIATLCGALPSHFRSPDLIIEVDRRGVATLALPKNGTVVLGSLDNLQEKVSVLARLVQSRPGFLATIKELNLTAPDYPVFVP